MHIYNGYALAPNLPGFFKAKCADLTPYLGGDAAKDYPYLAAIPTYAWKNSVSAIDGALYLIPIQRHLPIFPGFGGYFFANTDMCDKDIGADVNLKKRRRLQAHPAAAESAAVEPLGDWQQRRRDRRRKFLFRLLNYAAMFGAPNAGA